MPVLQLDQLVPGQEYTVVYMHHELPEIIKPRQRFLGLSNVASDMGFPIFDSGHGATSTNNPSFVQIYTIGDPDIPVIAPVAPVAVVAPAVGNNANAAIPVLSAMNGQTPDCPICYEPLINDDEHGVVVACETTVARAAGTAANKVICGHKFHRNCIRGWLDSQEEDHQVCPSCNQRVRRLRVANPEPQVGGSRKVRQRRKSRKNKQTRKNRQRRS
jgi:hypothetical protein